jgi:hypothetical protein
VVTMTVRDYVNRRVRMTLGMGIGICVLLYFVSLFVPRPLPPLLISSGLAALTGSVIISQTVKCVRCLKRIGNVAVPAAMPFGRAINFCPYCGAKFNDPLVTGDQERVV